MIRVNTNKIAHPIRKIKASGTQIGANATNQEIARNPINLAQTKIIVSKTKKSRILNL